MFANFNKKKLRMSFEHGVQNYSKSALIQRLSSDKLCKIAAPFVKKDSQILDLGSGTGFVAENLIALQNKSFGSKKPEKDLSKDSNIFELDLALKMLQKNQNHSFKIQGDFENLPFKKQSFDILISSFSLQWMTNFDKSFLQFFSLLKPKGILIFCLPTEGSLKELSAANIFNFNSLPKVDDLKTSLKKSGFCEISTTTENTKQTFESGLEALKSIKKIGANYAEKNSSVITKTNLIQFNNFCLKNFGTKSRKIEISWNVSYFIFQK